jgi:hypothetical protein
LSRPSPVRELATIARRPRAASLSLPCVRRRRHRRRRPLAHRTKSTPPKKTAIKCPETLAVLAKLVYNTAVMPKEAKYRKVKLGNATIAKTVGANADALRALELLGWRPCAPAAGADGSAADGSAAELELPEGTTLTMAQHRLVIAAADALASASLRRTYDKPSSASSSQGNLAALAPAPPQQQP